MKDKGFTLFIAIVITATLLLISTGVITVAVKQAFLTTANRHSQEAFYAADSALECVLFWDLKGVNGQSAFSTTTTSNISCNEQAISGVGGGSGLSTFTLNYGTRNCAEVKVTKRNVAPRTIVESLGYNDCDTDNPRRVQRAIRVSY